MINMMKWRHTNTINYQCKNLIINNIIIDKRTKSISLTEYHFNWLPFFSPTNFNRGVNCFKASNFSEVMFYFRLNCFELFNSFELTKGWLNQSLCTFSFILFQMWYSRGLQTGDDGGHSVCFIKLLLIFFKKSWLILALCNDAVVNKNSRSSFSKFYMFWHWLFIYALEMNWWNLQFFHFPL